MDLQTLNSFIHFIWLGTGLESVPKQVHHRVQCSASSSKFHYLLFSSRSSNSYLSLLSCLHVPSILPSMKFLCTLRPIQLAFHCFIVQRMFISSLTVCNTSSFLTWLVQLVVRCSWHVQVLLVKLKTTSWMFFFILFSMLIIIIQKVVVFCAAAHVFHETWFTVGFVGGYTLHCDLMSLLHAFITIRGLPWRSWIRALWYNYENNQQDAIVQVNLLFHVSSTCFGRCFCPSSEALDCIYSIL